MDKPKKTEGSRQSQSTQNEKAITGMNTSVQKNAYDNFNYDQPKAEELLKADLV
jgi:hypothetical protein